MRGFTLPDRAILIDQGLRLLLLIVGVFLAAFGFAVFLAPHNLAAGGIAGISVIINYYTGWPLGTLYFVLNLPLMVLGFPVLGRWPFVVRTLIAAALFALFTDLLTVLLPQVLVPFPPTDDLLLSGLYGGVLGGLGAGLVYRTGSTVGGTSIIGRIIQSRTGQPLSQSFIYTDGVILLAMGLVFGWQVPLYGLLILVINGLASDYALEGVSVTRVATIITNYPEEMSAALIASLGRGVSYWPVTGGYTGEQHFLVTCTLYRSQMRDIRRVVARVDPNAFVTIGISHQALGKGFRPL
jgi:uncharacterized membrane-anchored protein YitT (DUF2179 family)